MFHEGMKLTESLTLFTYIPRIFLNFILMCIAQHAELVTFPIIHFADLKTILVVMSYFTVSKPDEIFNFDTGDHIADTITAIF